ncbi:MAG: dTDP-4-amino-4,6-dideoxygalactose transaminase [Desulfobulbaceae bacterium]|nr:dTDP-4-amino-4,6-dideoxygalactose transaminase [Desulfobulbaceae bacterium]
MDIPFNKPFITGDELKYITQAVSNGQLSGNNYFTKQCQLFLERRLHCPKVLLTHSCTAALEMAAMLINIGPGDEVIVPDFTFVSTANAFVINGAKPVFVDIQPDTLNVDPLCIEKAITERTKAIVVVHYAGVACKMDQLSAIARKYEIALVEDNAHGLFGKYKGKNLGTFGCLATLSFHETKNLTCGEGGALLINDQSMMERAEIIWEKGTNRSKFFRGQVDKYSWVDVGSSYLPSELQAAFLLAQLEASERIQGKRKDVWMLYRDHLADWASENGVILPWVPEDCEQAYHMFYLIMPSLSVRQALINHLKKESILGVFHYLPLHLSPMGGKLRGAESDCPVSVEMSDKILRLPFYVDLSRDEQLRVITTIKKFSFADLD